MCSSDLAFVGKAAYRGAFGGRAELGAQPRRLGETGLFVLPSTSPANAAVPWRVRLRWFRELAGLASGLPVRDAVRALVVDPAGRTLLTRFEDEYGTWWAPPGGGTEPGETDEHALVRELAEECGLHGFGLGPLLWTRRHWRVTPARWAGQEERCYLVRADAFEPAPAFSPAQLAAEGVLELRWFTLEELSAIETGPANLASLVRDVLRDGPGVGRLEAEDG